MWRLISSLALVLAAPWPLFAAEKWAAPMAVPEGLILWLDASRQPAARKAHGRPPLKSGDALDVFYDGSGERLNLVQRVLAFQPRYLQAGQRAVVRFDGKDDFLGLAGLERRLEECTLFIVAAPRSNAGDFRGFFSINATGKNDYLSGLNVDMNAQGSSRFDVVNVEGAGFQGAVNLMKSFAPFGEFHLLEVQSRAGPAGVKLFLDERPAGTRKRMPGVMHLEQVTLGARCYSNTPDPPHIQGFLDGDIAEVLLFSRELRPEESRAVTAYLQKKYKDLGKQLATAAAGLGHLLQPVADPPPVQMLVPGFTVRRLPVDLPHINNLKYRDDGKLVALAYNGNIYLLSDRDGDGLEEHVELFWDNQGRLQAPIGMDLTPPKYTRGNGVFVASKGKLSLIVDKDGDDHADEEIVVARGWKPLDHGVDALGVALDRKGFIYFGLGTASYTNGYLVDAGGKGHYDLKSERGTILKVSPDFKSREILATGIRFSVGLRVNRLGDLFATDQEGATWLPNGNPFDELLHIEKGRHYGFPPRHPRHLPHVIDEPSVFDYGPQHQSTCGFCFNEPVNGGQLFGPPLWKDNAFVTGFSRGKVFRTSLVKTPWGYVAQTHLFACLQRLTVDACISPQGDLVLATHSGPPDWGTGPQGKAQLFKISWTGKQQPLPMPLFAWPAAPGEIHIAFDRPLGLEQVRKLSGQVRLEFGRYIRPGDRFETLHPPYQLVQQQLRTPRFDLPVLGVHVTPDRRTLVLDTRPQVAAASFALTLPTLDQPNVAKEKALPQRPMIDLGFDLTGVQATTENGRPVWLPHLDLTVARALTADSAEHDAFWAELAKSNRLTLRTQLNLWHMLRPALQEGSTLDYTLPDEEVTLCLQSANHAIDGVQCSVPVSLGKDKAGRQQAILKVKLHKAELTRLEVRLRSGTKPDLGVFWFTAEDPRPRALALVRLLLPWADARPQVIPVVENKERPVLKGGSWERGQRFFFGSTVQCGACHQVGGKGGKIGPDLSNLIHRDYDSVLRDIRFPSAAINPDYVAYLIALDDGRVLVGVPRNEGDKLLVGTAEGKEVVLDRKQIESMIPSPTSLMPEGLDTRLNAAELRDLLTFLLTRPMAAAKAGTADSAR
jgi:putative heme-binding domain-containing protein